MFLNIIIITVLLPLVTSRDYEWWENGNYYQIYPRSYQDTDGNGVGDLRGIMQRAQYLKDLGMDGVWLSPIMKSPMADFGYDISDYRSIDATFGTMEDFQALLAEFKRVQLHLILDFVPNHTSDEHDWFQRSVKREAGYENYYVWHPGKTNATGQRVPPNNYISHFFGSAWEWNEDRQEYYLHNFHKKQPDLNYREPLLVEEMKNVLRYWLALGVSGFRIDVMNHLFEVQDSNGDFPDEPLSGDCDNPEDYCYLLHIYTLDLPETYDMTYQWRDVLDEFTDETRIMMTEAYSPLPNIMRYFGNPLEGLEGSYIPFNFEFLTKVNRQSTGSDIKSIAETYMNMLPFNKSGNWVLGNHDQRRIASRLGESRVDLYNILLQTLPGHAITYNGEELGMTDVAISWQDTVDPQACNAGEENYDEYSRDPARTPFQWDDSKNAGFSTADKTWLPVADNYTEVNVKVQAATTNSHLDLFKKLVAIRKNPALKYGEYKSALIGDNVYAYIRKLDGEVYVIVLNFGTEEVNVNLENHFTSIKDKIVVKVAPKISEGTIFSTSSVTVPAESGFVAISGGSIVVLKGFLVIFLATLHYFIRM